MNFLQQVRQVVCDMDAKNFAFHFGSNFSCLNSSPITTVAMEDTKIVIFLRQNINKYRQLKRPLRGLWAGCYLTP